MLTLKTQHPQEVIGRVYMIDYLREITPDKAYEVLGKTLEGVFYEFENTEGEIAVDFNWESLLFVLTMDELQVVMNKLEKLVWEVEEQQSKVVAKEIEKKIDGGKPVDINLLAYAQAKLAQQKNQILGIDGKPIGGRGIL
mgnify:CR=1 FL=1